MTSIVFVPFIASAALVILSRLLSSRLRPIAAVSALAATVPVLALCTLAALGVLASPLAGRMPAIAAIGQWSPRAVESHSPVAPVASIVATILLAWIATRILRTLREFVRDVHVARALGAFQRHSGSVTVVDDPAAYAHSLGVGLFGWGRIVVSTGLLAVLDDEEREAVLAHEQAHLRQQHTVLCALANLSIAANPVLRPIASDLHLALERSADEMAASMTNREALASGVAKAALYSHGALRTSAMSFALHRHAVAERVAALLDEPARRTRPAWLLVALAAGSVIAITLALHDTERFFEAVRTWSIR